MLQEILDAYKDMIFLVADGLDDAVIGVDLESGRLIYSVRRSIIITARMIEEGVELTDEDMEAGIILSEKVLAEAQEYFDFNTRDAYVGEGTPIWCEDNF